MVESINRGVDSRTALRLFKVLPQMMPPELQAKLDFLVSRLKRGRGNQDVLVAEIIKTFNSRPARRQTDARVQGWTYLETGA